MDTARTTWLVHVIFGQYRARPVVVLVGLLALAPSTGASAKLPPSGQAARIYYVIDGDTVALTNGARVVLSVNLADYEDSDEFEARIYPELELIAKTELESGAGPERRVAQEAVRELLTTSSSKTAKTLRVLTNRLTNRHLRQRY